MSIHSTYLPFYNINQVFIKQSCLRRDIFDYLTISAPHEWTREGISFVRYFYPNVPIPGRTRGSPTSPGITSPITPSSSRILPTPATPARTPIQSASLVGSSSGKHFLSIHLFLFAIYRCNNWVCVTLLTYSISVNLNNDYDS